MIFWNDVAKYNNEQTNGVGITGMIHNYADVEKFYKNNISDKYKNVDVTNYKNLTSLRFNPNNPNQHHQQQSNYDYQPRHHGYGHQYNNSYNKQKYKPRAQNLWI